MISYFASLSRQDVDDLFELDELDELEAELVTAVEAGRVADIEHLEFEFHR